MTDREFMQVMAVLTGAYPAVTVSQQTERVYREMLRDLPYAAVMAAVRQHIATVKYFPAVAELRRLVAEAAAALPDPEQAWAEVVERVRQGFDGPRRWSCPAIGQVVEEIGWWALCQGTDPEAQRRQFLRRYGELREQAVRDIQTGRAPLPAGSAPESAALPDPEARAARVAALRRQNQERWHAICR